MKKWNLILFLFVFILINSCEKEENSSNNSFSLPIDAFIEGYIQKGPFIEGAIVRITELDDQLNQTQTIHTVSIDNNLGHYNYAATIDSRCLEFSITGNYYNETTGETSESEITLSALVETDYDINANLNVLTTISKKRILYLMQKSGLSFFEAREITEQEILSQFSIEEDNLKHFHQMDITENDASGAILLAITVILQNNRNAAQLNQFLTRLEDDLQYDGKIKTFYLEIIQEQLSTLDITGIKDNLNEWYSAAGDNLTVPNFEAYINDVLSIDLTSNLLAYYPCNENMNDASGNGYHAEGVNLSQAQDLNGIANQAFSLVNGSYIKYSLPLNIGNEPAWTYSLWLNIADLNTYIQVLLGLKYNDYGVGDDVPFYFGSNSEMLFSYFDGDSYGTNQNLLQNTWYHVAYVYSGQQAKIYLNGESLLTIYNVNFDTEGESVFNYYLSASTYTGWGEDLEAYLTGAVDEIRFYKRALNSFEMNELYNSSRKK
jgi:hypothetical protein